MITFNDKVVTVSNGKWINPTITRTPFGITYGTVGEYIGTLDLKVGDLKTDVTGTYMQISGGDWSAVRPESADHGSHMLWAPSAGVYSMTWEPQSAYSAGNTMLVREKKIHKARNLTAIETFDLFHYAKWQNYRADIWSLEHNVGMFYGEPIQKLPSTSSNIYNGENLSSFRQIFWGCSAMTAPIIPFITSMQAACPNLVDTYQCFSGCINAADYNEATAQYPQWF